MAKGKLAKFAELDRMEHVLQYPYAVLKKITTFPHRGKWGSEVFGNEHPLILELGCGRGEYTIALAREHPEFNFIGVDIKGNRIWNGAKEVEHLGLKNVRFLRTEIELLEHFFAPSELHAIWLTFPDPQMKKVRRRLTSSGFLEKYAPLLSGAKVLHLKTDSQFLYQYTKALTEANHLRVAMDYSDVYSEAPKESELRRIQTYYEQQWLQRGITIKYLQLHLASITKSLEEPEVEIERDSYRSYGREQRNQLNL